MPEAFKELVLRWCGPCNVRYLDLQAFDGISGEVYIAMLPLFLVALVITLLFFVSLYVRAWKSSGTYVPLCFTAAVSIWRELLAIVFFIFSLWLFNVDISDDPYPGMAIFLTAPKFPYLVGLSVQPLAIGLMQVIVIFIKLIKQRGKLMDG